MAASEPRPDGHIQPGASPLQRAAGKKIVVDVLTAEVVSYLQEQGIQPILLKGPSIARWLYDNAHERAYSDSDLLVDPSVAPAADEALGRLGFTTTGQMRGDRPRSNQDWLRARDGAAVDLHVTLKGLEHLDPASVWQVVAADPEEIVVAGTVVKALGLPARLLNVVLHALEDGGPGTKPMADLDRAVRRVPVETWSRSLDLARRLGAEVMFVRGVSLSGDATDLIRALDLTAQRELGPDVDPVARAFVSGFGWLARLTPLQRASLVVRKLFPPVTYMRSWARPAQRWGPAGLLIAYAWRPVWVVFHAVRAIPAWRRSRGR